MRSVDLFPAEAGGYTLPNCLQSEEDWDRLWHRDISDMSPADLKVETLRVKLAYAAAYGQRIFVHTTDPRSWISAEEWLCSRLTALENETLRRRGRRSA